MPLNVEVSELQEQLKKMAARYEERADQIEGKDKPDLPLSSPDRGLPPAYRRFARACIHVADGYGETFTTPEGLDEDWRRGFRSLFGHLPASQRCGPVEARYGPGIPFWNPAPLSYLLNTKGKPAGKAQKMLIHAVLSKPPAEEQEPDVMCATQGEASQEAHQRNAEEGSDGIWGFERFLRNIPTEPVAHTAARELQSLMVFQQGDGAKVVLVFKDGSQIEIGEREGGEGPLLQVRTNPPETA